MKLSLLINRFNDAEDTVKAVRHKINTSLLA